MASQVITLTNSEIIKLDKPGNYQVVLAKEGIEAQIQSTFLADHLKIELNLRIVHLAANTTSQTTLKGVGKNGGQINFQGTIEVDPQAINTNAFLTERILLLDSKSSAVAIPNLEINTDQVKCSHASTISTLDPAELFYLQSRGLTLDEATDMIVEGFLRG